MGELKHLGKLSNAPIDEVDLIDWTGQLITVCLDCNEFSAICPVTGQPDYGSLTIEYVPDRHLAETKSVKLYLWKYRDTRAFNESLVDIIATDLFEQVKPRYLRVVGSFHPRGGISVTATAERGNKEYRSS